MTVEEFRNLAHRLPKKKPSNKFHAEKVNGYASRKEYNRAQQLQLLQRSGAISNLREQVTYTLIPAQYGSCGVDSNGRWSLLERACKYVADFVYTDNSTGQTIVEDTKGVRTKEYIIKRKLMLYLHGIRIKEI